MLCFFACSRFFSLQARTMMVVQRMQVTAIKLRSSVCNEEACAIALRVAVVIVEQCSAIVRSSLR